MKKILFLGLLFNERSLYDAYKCSKCGVQMAPHIYQKRIIDGIRNRSDTELSLLSVPPVGSFPMNYKKPIIKNEKNGWDVQVGFINFPIIKHKIQKAKIIKEIEKRISDSKDFIIILYSLYPPFVYAASEIKRRYPNVHISLIQTDAVPGRNDMERYMTKERIRVGNELINKSKVFDSFIILSKYLDEPLEIENRKSIILECVCDKNQKENCRKESSDNIFLYSGTLDKEFGVENLINAFKKLPEAQLWICGNGNCKEFLINAAKEYGNIKYFGFLTQAEVNDLRDKCDYLINPRTPTGTYTKYSFPSKTAEYMMSGKPVVMYKLEGVPDEYDDYLIYLNDSTPDGIAEELSMIIKADYGIYLSKASKGRKFMLENKTSDIAAEKIIRFLTE